MLILACLLGPAMVQPGEAPVPAFVAHLTPPAVVRGQTTRITCHGSRLGVPVDLWTSLPVGKVKAIPVAGGSADAVTYDVQVAADAPVGVHGARIATVDGLSNLVFFYVEDLPLRSMPANEARERSSRQAEAQSLPKVELPVALWGTFREAVVDRVAIDVATGQKVSFEVVANRLGKDVDPLVAIRDRRGTLVAEVDNSPGLYFDCRFEHTFREAGTNTIELRDSRYHGDEEGHYILRMGKFPAARVAVPAAVRAGEQTRLRLPEIDGAVIVAVPKDQPAGPFLASVRRPGDEGSADLPLTVASGGVVTFRRAPQPPLGETAGSIVDAVTTFGLAVTIPGMNGLWLIGGLAVRLAAGTEAPVPSVLCGVLEKPGEENVFWIRLQRGERIRLTGEYRGINSPADLEIAVVSVMGRELGRVADTAQDGPLVLELGAPADGTYGIRVRDLSRDGGPAYAYRIAVERAGPHLQLNAEVEGLTVPRGSYQTVPISVVRKDCPGRIRLVLEGAPPGVALCPGEIGEKETAVVCKLAATATAPLGVSTVRIWAQPVLPLDGLAFGAAGGLKLPAAVVQALLPRFPVATSPLIDRQRHNVDQIPISLREDQRRLPPAVTDRLALQITPPAPFTLELPEQNVTLYRFCQVGFPLATTRIAGFDGPIHFSAHGGQIGPKSEGRTRVYAEFPVATPRQPSLTGSIHTRILVNLQKHRVDVTGTGEHHGRRVFLTRTFDLDVRTAFEVVAELPRTELAAGASGKVKLIARRFAPLAGPINVELSPTRGLSHPEKVIIPRDADSIEVPVTAQSDAAPGRYAIPLQSTANVNGFEEEIRGRPVAIEVRKKR